MLEDMGDIFHISFLQWRLLQHHRGPRPGCTSSIFLFYINYFQIIIKYNNLYVSANR